MMRAMTGIAVALLAGFASADAGGAPRATLWNAASVATVEGEVQAVERIEMGSWACVRLRLRTAEGPIALRVAPEWYLAAKRIRFAPGDRLRVTGSRLRFSGEAAMVAGEIVRDAEQIVLRDEGGRAVWADL